MAKLLISYTTYQCWEIIEKVEKKLKNLKYEDDATHWSFPNGVSYWEGTFIVEGSDEVLQKLKEEIEEFLKVERWDYITERKHPCIKSVKIVKD